MKLFWAVLALVALSPLAAANAADNVVCPVGSGCTLTDNAGDKWRASVAFTTDGSGDIFTLGDVASTDNTIGAPNSSNRILIDNSGIRWPAAVFYTTDGDGNVIPVPSGGGSSYTFTPPLVNTSGAVSCNVASGSQPGCLASADWTTFNGKQAAGSYMTAITGPVSAAGPGSAPATLSPFENRVYVDFASGNDSTGNGSAYTPWKTIQHACDNIIPTVNIPVTIYLSGGNNDTDVGPISCAPNIALFADYYVQIPVNFEIDGGSADAQVWAQNVFFLGTFTWVRNDSSAMSLNFIDVEVAGLLDFEQDGAGIAQTALFAYGGGIAGGMTISAGEAFINGGSLYGAVNYLDSGAAYFYVIGADLYSTVVSLSGGISAYFSGDVADYGYSISGATTGSGTPTITSDPGSLPPIASVTGAYTLSMNVNSFVSQSAVGSQPACTATLRGLQWLVDSGSGVADIFQICQQTVSGFAWVTH